MNGQPENQLDTFQDQSIAVYGGGGGWGDRITRAASNLFGKTRIVEQKATPAEAIAAARESDILFMATPDPVINDLLIEVRNQLRPGKGVIDCATNKSGFADTLTSLAEDGVSVCSTHPMVKPETSPRGQTVIIMPIGEHAQLAQQVAQRIFVEMGMRPEELDFAQHADMMVILQMVPHLIHRILIHAMAHGLQAQEMSIEDVSRLAPANYLLSELGVGRVGIQRPEVSAGIVMTALQTPLGHRVLGGIQETIGRIIAADKREELSALFTSDVNLLDPNGSWREEMTKRTDAALTRLGNLRLRSFQVTVPDRPAVLRDVLSIMHDLHDIDMTALDSQIIDQEDGTALARFDVGITDQQLDFQKLAVDLERVGASITFPRSALKSQGLSPEATD
ncbi:MAG: prephenate dehydrogenase/arogenate dehydrogenase family protein [Candidatus Peribacteraceae bacterium]|jgi:prephenate dehydrogenase